MGYFTAAFFPAPRLRGRSENELIEALNLLPPEAKEYQACYYDTDDGTLTISIVQVMKPQGNDPRFQHDPYIQLL